MLIQMPVISRWLHTVAPITCTALSLQMPLVAPVFFGRDTTVFQDGCVYHQIGSKTTSLLWVELSFVYDHTAIQVWSMLLPDYTHTNIVLVGTNFLWFFTFHYNLAAFQLGMWFHVCISHLPHIPSHTKVAFLDGHSLFSLLSVLNAGTLWMCHCCDEAFLKWCSIYWNPMYHSYDCEI